MKKRSLRLWYSDMWGHGEYMFNPERCYFTQLLRLRYEIELCGDSPDVLIFSCFGNDHKDIDATVKIYFCGENSNPPGVQRTLKPDYDQCSFSLSHWPGSSRNYYFPLWILFVNWFHEPMPLELPANPTFLIQPDELISRRECYLESKDRFCCFINNNPVEDRISLFHSLESYRSVDSYGSLFNNVGYRLGGHEGKKMDVLKRTFASIAYENSYLQGYNTEKVIQPYARGCFAIYSGGLDRSIFNSRALFYLEDYRDQEEMVADIVKHYEDSRLSTAKIYEPLFYGNKIPDFAQPVSVLSWIESQLDEQL